VITACVNQEAQKKIESESLVAESNGEEVHSNKTEQENIIDKSSGIELVDNSRIIQEQSFRLELNHWGGVQFVSYMPTGDVNFEDASFLLERDGEVIYSFPYYYENNNTENHIGLFDSVAAVGFRDINNDGLKDVIVIIHYITGAGPQGMMPRPTARIFLADEEGFYLAVDLIDEISDNIEEKELSIQSIYEYVENTIDTKEEGNETVLGTE